MTIDFTPEEAQFIFDNFAKLSVPLAQGNGQHIHAVGHAVLLKLKAGIEAETDATKDDKAAAAKA